MRRSFCTKDVDRRGLDDRGGAGGGSPRPRRCWMARMMADCRRFPSESNCSLTIIGEEDEGVRAAAGHAASVHGHWDPAEVGEQIKQFLEPAEAYSNEARPQEAMPT